MVINTVNNNVENANAPCLCIGVNCHKAFDDITPL